MSIFSINTTRTLTPAAGVERVYDFYSDLIDNDAWWDLWIAEADKVALNASNVTTWLSKRSEAGHDIAAQSSTRRPVWTPEAGDGLPALTFERYPSAAPDGLTVAGFPAAAGVSWTKYALFKAPTYNGAGNTGDLFSTASSGNRHQLRMNYNTNSGDFINALVGAGSNQVSVTINNRPVDEWVLVENAWDADTHTVGLALNGGAFSIDTTTTAVPAGHDPACLADVTDCNIGSILSDGSGQGFFGQVRMAGVFKGNAMDPAHAGAREVILRFAQRLGLAA